MSEALTPLRRTLLILACLAGLGLSAALAVYHFHGQVALFSSLCRQESLGLDCVAVARSPHSRIFGVPQALVGMGFFLLQLGYTVGTTARRGALWHAVPAWLAVAGLLYCLRMAWIMTGLGQWCVFCVAVYGVVAVIAGLRLPWWRGGLLRTLHWLGQRVPGWLPHAAVVALAAAGTWGLWQTLRQHVMPEVPPSQWFEPLAGVVHSAEHLDRARRLQSAAVVAAELEKARKQAEKSPELAAQIAAVQEQIARELILVQATALPGSGTGDWEIVLVWDFSPVAAGTWRALREAMGRYRHPPRFGVAVVTPPGPGRDWLDLPDTPDFPAPDPATVAALQGPLLLLAAGRQDRVPQVLDALDALAVTPPTPDSPAEPWAQAAAAAGLDVTLPLIPDGQDRTRLRQCLADGRTLLEGAPPIRLALDAVPYLGPPAVAPLLAAMQWVRVSALVDPDPVALPRTGGVSTGTGRIPVEITLFGDLHCGACAATFPELQTVLDHFQGAIRLRYRHYPRSSSCNPAASGAEDPDTCEGARIVQAAETQAPGEGWAVLSAIYGSDHTGMKAADFLRLAADPGGSADVLERLTATAAVREAVSADIALGNQLALEATPVLYLNGHRLRAGRSAAALLAAVEAVRSLAPGPAAGSPVNLDSPRSK